MTLAIFTCEGGSIELPDAKLVLVDRADGGNLIVTPPREVWERSELLPAELTAWSFLVAATGRAMLETLPQLDGGCINYWEAGNWSLNHEAEPRGPKLPRASRRVHLHLLGRSRNASHRSWVWGEAPVFPKYRDRFTWASQFRRLTPDECIAVITKARSILTVTYGLSDHDTARCESCGYPIPITDYGQSVCGECSTTPVAEGRN